MERCSSRALRSACRVKVRRAWGAVDGRTQATRSGLLKACAKPGACGNSEAVCPSSPMPKMPTSSGHGSAAKRCCAAWAKAVSAASLSSPSGRSSKKGTKVAAAAGPCKRCWRTKAVLLSGWVWGTQRSSTSTTVTADQFNADWRKRSNKAIGDLPPETASKAWPRCPRACCKASATCCAKRSVIEAPLMPLPPKPISRAPSKPRRRQGPSCRRCRPWVCRPAAASLAEWGRTKPKRLRVRRGA